MWALIRQWMISCKKLNISAKKNYNCVAWLNISTFCNTFQFC